MAHARLAHMNGIKNKFVFIQHFKIEMTNSVRIFPFKFKANAGKKKKNNNNNDGGGPSDSESFRPANLETRIILRMMSSIASWAHKKTNTNYKYSAIRPNRMHSNASRVSVLFLPLLGVVCSERQRRRQYARRSDALMRHHSYERIHVNVFIFIRIVYSQPYVVYIQMAFPFLLLLQLWNANTNAAADRKTAVNAFHAQTYEMREWPQGDSTQSMWSAACVELWHRQWRTLFAWLFHTTEHNDTYRRQGLELEYK